MHLFTHIHTQSAIFAIFSTMHPISIT